MEKDCKETSLGVKTAVLFPAMSTYKVHVNCPGKAKSKNEMLYRLHSFVTLSCPTDCSCFAFLLP